MAAESTATELNAYLTTNFISGTGLFKLATLKTFLQNFVASVKVALSQTKYQSLTGELGVTITFDTAFSAGSTYQLVWWAFDASGNEVACTITNMTITGFSVRSIVDCTFHYYAIKNN